MHHKYIVRDAGTADAWLWTGSANWTDDSWRREENVILKLPSPELAAEYARNFAELWTTGRVEGTGKYDLASEQDTYQDARVKAHVLFSPERGRQMAQLIADKIPHAKRRVRVCSPVITAEGLARERGARQRDGGPDH